MQALRIITEEHRNLWRLAITVDAVAAEIIAGATIDQAFFTSVFDYLEHFVDGFHHPKEDDYLFRILRTRTKQADVLDHLQSEHRSGPQQLAQLREQMTQAALGRLDVARFAESLRSYTQHLKAHIKTEEGQVLPLARDVLTAADWLEIDAAFLDHADPLFGDKAKAEFRQLFHRIVSLAPESVGLGGHSQGKLEASSAASRSQPEPDPAQGQRHGKLLWAYQGPQRHYAGSARG